MSWVEKDCVINGATSDAIKEVFYFRRQSLNQQAASVSVCVWCWSSRVFIHLQDASTQHLQVVNKSVVQSVRCLFAIVALRRQLVNGRLLLEPKYYLRSKSYSPANITSTCKCIREFCQVIVDSLFSYHHLKGTNWYSYDRATGRHPSYGITQCYLLPDTSERAP